MNRRHGMPELARRYAIAGGAVLIAAAFRMILHPALGERALYLPFMAAVLAAGTFGGIFPAIFATCLSIIVTALFIKPLRLATGDLVEVATFVLTAACIVLLSRALSRLRLHSSRSDDRAREQAAHASDMADELNLLIDGAADYAIYMLDPTGRVTIWNRGAERLKGWTEQEVLGQRTAMFYPRDAVGRGKPEADLETARRNGKLEEEDWRRRKDGSEFLAHVSITALHDEAGRLRGFGKVVRDVTEERAVDRKLRASEAQLRSVLATVPDAMIVIDERGAIISFSPTAERLFGYSEEELAGRNVSVLMPTPDREAHDGYMQHYFTTGERRIIGMGRTVTGLKRDGATFPLELYVGEALSDDRRIFTGFVRDMTEKVAADDRLEELRSGLIHVARVSAMGTMASTLAHELNQPITAVANYMEAVRDLLGQPDPDDLPMIRDALDEAAKEAIRAGQIVRRLREFVAKGEVGKTVEPLPALVADAAKLATIGAREKGIEVRFDLHPAASPVLVDKVQIQQVLINLIRNGIEAVGDAPVKLLTVTSRDDGPGVVRLSVGDSGPGVTPDVAENLFRAFTSTKPSGMGLGLSICRTIVEVNGGRIWLEPRQTGGATFHFTLIKAESEAVDDG